MINFDFQKWKGQFNEVLYFLKFLKNNGGQLNDEYGILNFKNIFLMIIYFLNCNIYKN